MREGKGVNEIVFVASRVLLSLSRACSLLGSGPGPGVGRDLEQRGLEEREKKGGVKGSQRTAQMQGLSLLTKPVAEVRAPSPRPSPTPWLGAAVVPWVLTD